MNPRRYRVEQCFFACCLAVAGGLFGAAIAFASIGRAVSLPAPPPRPLWRFLA